MYIVKVKSGLATFEKEYKCNAYAVREAAMVANRGTIYWNNPEVAPHERTFTVDSVTVYDDAAPDLDIDF